MPDYFYKVIYLETRHGIMHHNIYIITMDIEAMKTDPMKSAIKIDRLKNIYTSK